MVTVKGGPFKSGAALTSVDVKEFSIDIYEVTAEQYAKFDKEYEATVGREKHPATEVSYFQAEEYCKSLGKRLPTDHEWEKAARGTDGFIYPWGNDFVDANANTLESELNSTAEVGSRPAGKSPYGVHDMAGNVWEWVDAWETDSKQYRLTFGGSFFDDSSKAKTFVSLKSIPDDSHTFIGFRCAK